jgi:hypothetical protein
VEDQAELRDAVIELGQERGQADEQRGGERDPGHHGDRRRRAPAPVPRTLAPALLPQHREADHRQQAAAEHEDVGRAPQGHVLPEQAVPDVVDRKGKEGEQPAGGDQDRPGWSSRARRGQRGGEAARSHDPVDPDEDQVVRGVGEGTDVAAIVKVQGDVPHEPDVAQDERERAQEQG